MKNFWQDKKVLVTGAGGFVGSHVVEMLINEGALVTAQISVNNTKKIPENLVSIGKKIKIIKGDLEDYGASLKATKNQDIVFNFAGLDGGASFKRKYSAKIFNSNSHIVLSMLEAAKENKVKRFLLVSSVEVYPESTPQPIYERYGFMKGLNEKIDGYAWSKRFSEIAAKLFSVQYGMKISIVRLGNVYGPRDHIEKGTVIPMFITQALKNKPITVWDGGKQKKSFIYVWDLVYGLLKLVEKYPKPDPVNLAGERYITIHDLARTIIKLSKSKSKIISVDKNFPSKDRVISVSKVKKITNFQEKISLEDGLTQTIDFFKSNKGL